MDYNSNREKLILPEYGRNIQNMVNHAMSLEDREERNKAARSIIDVMGNLYPYLRDIADFRHKLWDHLAIMSDFKMDIDYPYDPPRPETFQEPPKTVEYPQNRMRYRHYGKILELMVARAIDYPDGIEKNALIQMLADHMKKSYMMWNKEEVGNDVIINDLREMSGGKLEIPEGFELTDGREINQQRASRKKAQNNNNGKRQYNNNKRRH